MSCSLRLRKTRKWWRRVQYFFERWSIRLKPEGGKPSYCVDNTSNYLGTGNRAASKVGRSIAWRAKEGFMRTTCKNMPNAWEEELSPSFKVAHTRFFCLSP